MNLNSRQIAQLIEELQQLLVGLRLRDVQALPPRDVVLIFEPDDPGTGPPVFRLRISADADNSRLHLQQGRIHRGSGPTGPFYRKLEEELIGARLAGLSQVRGDRIALLEFKDCKGGAPRSLFAELTGRHANLILADRTDRVLDFLVPAPAKQKTPRLVLGESWEPPPGRAGGEAEPPSIEDKLPEPSAVPPAVEMGYAPIAPLSWRVESILGASAANRDDAAARKKLKKRIERKLSRARSLLNGLERKLEACGRAERLRLDGELLASNAHSCKRGAKFVELQDWYADGQPMRRIELDPRRSPQENAEHFFERYKKLERTKSELPRELELARPKVEELEQLLLDAADEDQQPDEVDARGVAASLLDAPQQADPRKRKAPAVRLPYRSFTTLGGMEVRVGRSAKDNDALTFKHSNGNDLWLHTADAPGSHVILRMGNQKAHKGPGGKKIVPEPPHEDLMDAATLAIHFSPLRDASKAAVHVAACKLVHKPRGAKPGLVTLSGGRNLEIRMQPERLARLVRPNR